MRQGYRLFHCDSCRFEARWPCRNVSSPGGEICPCCGNQIHPLGWELHPEWPLDPHGNLLLTADGDEI